MSEPATPFGTDGAEQVHHWQAPQLDRPDPRAARKPPPTAAHLEALEQAAWDEGYQRGRKEGEAAARKAAEPKIDHLRLLIAALDEPLAADRAQLTDTLCQLTVALARTLTEQALALDPAAQSPWPKRPWRRWASRARRSRSGSRRPPPPPCRHWSSSPQAGASKPTRRWAPPMSASTASRYRSTRV